MMQTPIPAIGIWNLGFEMTSFMIKNFLSIMFYLKAIREGII